ncbi:hypothetical protein BDW66DRAFT_135950 [Aspergillus desertorum]
MDMSKRAAVDLASTTVSGDMCACQRKHIDSWTSIRSLDIPLAHLVLINFISILAVSSYFAPPYSPYFRISLQKRALGETSSYILQHITKRIF